MTRFTPWRCALYLTLNYILLSILYLTLYTILYSTVYYIILYYTLQCLYYTIHLTILYSLLYYTILYTILYTICYTICYMLLLQFHPLASDVLASSAQDFQVKVWDLQTETSLTLEGHSSPVSSMISLLGISVSTFKGISLFE